MNTLIQLGQLLLAVTEIEGRKKLQKMVHILQEFGVPFEVRYGYHHYGPFSEQLQEAVQSCLHDHLISETKVEGNYPTSRFTADAKLISLLDIVVGEAKPSWVSFAQELNSKTPRELEAVSTLVYLEKQNPEILDEMFLKLKPNLKEILPRAKSTLSDFRARYSGEVAA